ncbi:glutamine synthetase family protein [Actinomadura oligospora]|uniref:glutamine synthetase family protein n=1 Tax=Actinomadura oligospora TaxID=111804 RepID=UPI001B7FF0C0|nr:glutamine synthetase family protein [Actinomadura oligospora]
MERNDSGAARQAFQPLDADDRKRMAAHAARLVPELEDLAGVVLGWVDTSGITRIKTVPVPRLEHAAEWGVGMAPCFDVFLLDDSIVAGEYIGGPVGDLRLHPDLDRLVRLAALPGWAWAPVTRYTQEGTVHPLDSRALLAREVERLAELGWSVRGAFEIEWSLSDDDGTDHFTPACKGPAYSMTRLSELNRYLRDLLDALTETGVSIDQLHPEYAPGQYELSFAAEDPVGAADTAILVRETIRAVSLDHGMVASFSPKVLADSVGNGGHIHLSLWRDEPARGRAEEPVAGAVDGPVNMMTGGHGPFGLTAEGEAFAAGILGRLSALLAIGAPTVSSYLRLIPSHWAGVFGCWGLENREAAIRLVTGAVGDRGRAANIEIKCFDEAANPHLLLAALLAAGRAGLAAKAALPEPIAVDPASLSDTERIRLGIEQLPESLAEAVAAFERDEVLAEALGPEVIDTVATVRRGEIELFAQASPEQITESTRWRH